LDDKREARAEGGRRFQSNTYHTLKVMDESVIKKVDQLKTQVSDAR